MPQQSSRGSRPGNTHMPVSLGGPVLPEGGPQSTAPFHTGITTTSEAPPDCYLFEDLMDLWWSQAQHSLPSIGLITVILGGIIYL